MRCKKNRYYPRAKDLIVLLLKRYEDGLTTFIRRGSRFDKFLGQGYDKATHQEFQRPIQTGLHRQISRHTQHRPITAHSVSGLSYECKIAAELSSGFHAISRP